MVEVRFWFFHVCFKGSCGSVLGSFAPSSDLGQRKPHGNSR